MPLKLKLNEQGNAVLVDGNPVYIHDDGKEVPFDANSAVGTITRITEESKGFKTRAQTAETRLTAFEGLDPEKAKKALDIVQNLDDKKLVDAGEVERVKAAAIESVEAKYKPYVEENGKLKGKIKDLTLSTAFGNSKFITDKLILPADAIRKLFEGNVSIDDATDKIVAKDSHGNIINSKTRHGEPADLDEALETIVMGSPLKDTLLKPTGNTGDGARPALGGGGNIDQSLSPAARITQARQQAAQRR